jgi:predicted CopG family antitoxin
MMYKNLKMIAVSQENYLALKRLGSAGDSFNDVINEMLKKRKPLQTASKVAPEEQSAKVEPKTIAAHRGATNG